jgi:argininosuccinate lyase
MLAHTGIISPEEGEKLVAGLEQFAKSTATVNFSLVSMLKMYILQLNAD